MPRKLTFRPVGQWNRFEGVFSQMTTQKSPTHSFQSAVRLWVFTGVIGSLPVIAILRTASSFFIKAELPACLDPLWGACDTWTYAFGGLLESWAIYAAVSFPCTLIGVWLGSRILKNNDRFGAN
jgi:hypothetical protein